MKKITILALAIITMVSCSKEEGNKADTTTKVAVEFSNGVITRALDNSWEADDKIGIYMVAKDAKLTDANAQALDNGANVIHTVSEAGATGTFTPAQNEIIYFPIDGSAVDFYAYYPHQIGITDGIYKVNVATQTNFSVIDLLASKVVNKTKEDPTVALEFAHQLSKITLNISKGVGVSTVDLEGLTVIFEGLSTTADFNLTDNSFTSLDNTKNIISATNAKGTMSQAILIPSQAISGARVVFTLNATQEKFYWDISDKALVSGKNVSYDITMNRKEIIVSGSTITEWTPEDGGNGNAN